MKILIWDKNTKLLNTGGPSGYLYNVHEYLKKYPHCEISFYSDLINKVNVQERRKSQENKSIKSFILRNPILKLLYTLGSTYFKSEKLTPKEIDLIKGFDYIHFHWLSEILRYHKCLKRTSIKTILTTHTPEPLIDEITNNNEKKIFIFKINKIRNIFIRREISAFKYADYIMFPSKYSREVYSNASNIYKKELDKLDYKFFYVPTAIDETKKNNNIDTPYSKIVRKCIDCLNICYIGRHTEVKGYDVLKEIAIKTWKENKNVYFYIGGKEGPLYGLKDLRWHELGWVNTTYLLNEIDAFILPNKETYYDLILLEVLKSGKPIILTQTGGNKHFMNIVPNNGLFYYKYNNISSALEQIKKIYELKKEGLLDKIGQDNIILFNTTSSMPIYIKKYIEEINLLDKNK